MVGDSSLSTVLFFAFSVPQLVVQDLFVAEKLVPGGHRSPLKTVFAESSEKETAVELNGMSCIRSFHLFFCSGNLFYNSLVSNFLGIEV